MRRFVGVVVGAAILGCGGVADKIEDKAAEVATEKIIENQTGGTVDINGDKVSLSKDGTTAQFGAGSALPADWPAELAPPDGSVAQGVMRTASAAVPGKYDFFAMFDKTGDCAATMQRYKDKLGTWKVTGEFSMDGSTTAMYASPDGTAQISLGCTKSDDNSATTVSYSNTVAPTP